MNRKTVLLVAIFVALIGGASALLWLRPRGGPSAGAGQTLHLYAMSNYFPEEVLRKFEASHDCEVRYDNFASNEELLAKLQAGATGYDVIVPSDYMVTALVDSELLLDLDKSKIPNAKNLAPDFTKAPFDPGNRYAMPYTWGTSGLAYDSNHVKDPIDSWAALFDKRYAGKISMLDDGREALGAMLKLQGFSVNTIDQGELKKAQAKLMELKPNVRLFSSDAKQSLESGDIWIAHIYSGDAQQLVRDKPGFRYVVPKEGAVAWIDTLAIPKTAPNRDLAHAFIDFILEEDTAVILTDALRYGSPNLKAEGRITDLSLRAGALAGVGKGRLEFLKDMGDQTAVWDQLWAQVKSK